VLLTVAVITCLVAIQQVQAHALEPVPKSFGSLLHPELTDDMVVLVPSADQCDLNQVIKVSYQRVANDRDPSEKSDYIGLFRIADPTTLAPYDVATLTDASQTGEVNLRCRRAGDMEVRIVRLPGVIIGRVPLKVFGACVPTDCSGHGKCNKGQCECVPGWEGEGCALLSGEGVTIGWLNNPTGEFYFGDELVAKISHSSTEAVSSGADTVGVFNEKHTTQPVQSVFIPAGKSEVVVPMPEEAGTYFLRFTRGADAKDLASSTPFGVYNLCPNSCSFHGSCKKGVCECQKDFDRSDCSRGPGVATVTVTDEAYAGEVVNVKFSRDETVAGLLSDRDWIGLYPSTDDTTDNPVGYAFAIADRVYDPDVIAKKTSNVTSGTVQLVMPEAGKYVVKYVHQDYAKYAVSPEFTVYAPCNNNCSSRGPCQQGGCVCPPKWTGDECSLGMADFSVTVSGVAPQQPLVVGDSVSVAFTRPVGNNTDYDFIGLYGAASSNSSDLLFGYAYAIADPSDEDLPSASGTVQLQLVSSGKMTIRYINAYTLETEAEVAQPVSVYSECPNKCSGQGVCIEGQCKCSKEWKGDDCSLGAGLVALTLTLTDGAVFVPLAYPNLKVHYLRPVNHTTVNDFIALFPESGPFNVESNLCYSYTTAKDDTDVNLFMTSTLRAAYDSNPSTKYVVKYMSGAHEDLGTSDAFVLRLEVPTLQAHTAAVAMSKKNV